MTASTRTKRGANGNPTTENTRLKPETNGTKAKAKEVEIPRMDLRQARITLKGDSALICNRWSEKAVGMILDKQMKKAKTAKAAKEPFQDFLNSLYWMSERPANVTEATLRKAKFGMPAVAFKSAAVDACSHVDGITKVAARGAFHIDGDLVEILGHPRMREDMVRVGMGTSDIRYRGEFPTWSCTFVIRYNASVLSLEQIVNLFDTAGFSTGVGEWRPTRDGSFGMFHVEQKGEA